MRINRIAGRTRHLTDLPGNRGSSPCGAGDGNRTHVASLEGWNSTIELHPHIKVSFNMLSQRGLNVNSFFEIFPVVKSFTISAKGF